MDREYDLFNHQALWEMYEYKVCDLCQVRNGPKSDSTGFMCEGRWCSDATDYLIDDMEDEDLEPFLLEKIVAKAHYETYGKLLIRRR